MSMAFGIVILLSLATLVYGKSLFATYPFCEHINQNECITYMSTVKCVQFVWAIRSCCLHGIRWARREIRSNNSNRISFVCTFSIELICVCYCHGIIYANPYSLFPFALPIRFIDALIIIIIKPIQFNSTLKYASDFSDYFCCCQFVVEKKPELRCSSIMFFASNLWCKNRA